MKQGLETRQTLQQKLSPLQIQTIKLIEMPIQVLEPFVREELNNNPVLDDTPQERKDDEGPKDVSISEMDTSRGASSPPPEGVSSRTGLSFSTSRTCCSSVWIGISISLMV